MAFSQLTATSGQQGDYTPGGAVEDAAGLRQSGVRTAWVFVMNKLHIVTASELQRSSGKVLKRVAQENQHLIVERDGYRVAAMMPYPEYESLMRLRAVEAHRQLGRILGARVEQRGLSEKQLSDDLEAAKRQVHAERYPNAGPRR